MKLHRLLLVGLLASPALLAAQERITMGMTPRFGQVLSSRTTLAMVTDIAPNMGADTPPIEFPRMKMEMTMVTAATTTIGVPDEQGRYEATVAVDEMSNTITMNGQPAPFPVPTSALSGTTITFTYDRDGKIVDAKAPGMDAMIDMVKKMILNVAGLASPVSLAIGETSTVATTFSLPLPGGTGPLSTAEMRMTLVSITPEGADRIAHLTTTTTSRVAGLSAPGPAGSDAGVTMEMSGTGTLDVNLDRGFAKSVQTEGTFDTAMALPGKPGTSMPPMRMHGTMKMSATTESR
jgi:hypothetical protein